MNSNLYQDILWRCTRYLENITANESFKMEHGLPIPTWFANPMVCLYQHGLPSPWFACTNYMALACKAHHLALSTTKSNSFS